MKIDLTSVRVWVPLLVGAIVVIIGAIQGNVTMISIGAGILGLPGLSAGGPAKAEAHK